MTPPGEGLTASRLRQSDPVQSLPWHRLPASGPAKATAERFAHICAVRRAAALRLRFSPCACATTWRRRHRRGSAPGREGRALVSLRRATGSECTSCSFLRCSGTSSGWSVKWAPCRSKSCKCKSARPPCASSCGGRSPPSARPAWTAPHAESLHMHPRGMESHTAPCPARYGIRAMGVRWVGYGTSFPRPTARSVCGCEACRA